MNPLARKGKLGNSHYSYKASKARSDDAGSHKRGQKMGDKAVTQKGGNATPLHAEKVMADILAEMRKNPNKTSTLSYYDNVTKKMSR